jgi:hypothetical protein
VRIAPELCAVGVEASQVPSGAIAADIGPAGRRMRDMCASDARRRETDHGHRGGPPVWRTSNRVADRSATVRETSKGNFVRRAGLTAAVVAAAAAASAGVAAGTASAESAPASLSDVAAAAQPDSALSAVLARVDAEAGSVTPLGWYLK